MKQDLILLPLFAMVLLTFGIGIRMLLFRFKAVRKDGVNAGYFQLNRGAKLPDYLVKVTNHYNNLFELPVLFYVATIILYASNRADATYVSLAWLFVFLRYVHSYVHTTYNDVKHRRLAFLSGTLVLAVIWIRLMVQTIG
jgi:hypothetical protein